MDSVFPGAAWACCFCRDTPTRAGLLYVIVGPKFAGSEISGMIFMIAHMTAVTGATSGLPTF